MTSGGSVIALKYKDGAVMASDTLLSYGSMAKLPNIPRTKFIGEHTAFAATGDYADFQNAAAEMQEIVHDMEVEQMGYSFGPKALFSYLQRTTYSKRTDFQPFMCSFVVIGHRNGEGAFVGAMDSIGTRWTDDAVATGYGAHIGLPLIRKALQETPASELTRDAAVKILEDCMRVLFYRECRTVNRIQITVAEGGCVKTSDPYTLDTQFEHSGFAFEKTAIIR